MKLDVGSVKQITWYLKVKNSGSQVNCRLTIINKKQGYLPEKPVDINIAALRNFNAEQDIAV